MHNLNTVYDRNNHQQCLTSFTTTLDMKRKDVVYGSKVGNTTNPQFLEINSWVTGLILIYYISIIMHFNDTLVSRLHVTIWLKHLKNIQFWLIHVYY